MFFFTLRTIPCIIKLLSLSSLLLLHEKGKKHDDGHDGVRVCGVGSLVEYETCSGSSGNARQHFPSGPIVGLILLMKSQSRVQLLHLSFFIAFCTKDFMVANFKLIRSGRTMKENFQNCVHLAIPSKLKSLTRTTSLCHSHQKPPQFF